MAIIWEDDLEGTPTSGTPTTGNHTWCSAVSGAMSYTSATVDGLRAIAAGPAFGGMDIDLTSYQTGRLRWYGQWSGTQSGHHFLTGLFDTSTYRADSQIRNSTGGDVWNRWNFVSGGATTDWAANTPWRFEYRWEAGVGTLLEVWSDPADTGEPDWAITASGSEAFNKVGFGNVSITSGLTVLFGALAMSEGERIGPYSAFSGFNLMATTFDEDRIDLAWDAYPDATGYDIERDGSVILTNHSTTTYSNTGLDPSTEYDYRVRARY